MKTLTLALFLLASVASAAPIPGLYNTGVDDEGNILAPNTLDPHYTLTVSPDPSFPGPDIFTSSSIPSPPWLVEGLGSANPNSRWITPNTTGGNVAGAPDNYTVSTTFDLTGFDHTTASITGRWSTDNSGIDIILNGTSTFQSTTGDFSAWHDLFLDVASDFVAGVNTIEFVFNNAGDAPNPGGLRVEMVGTVDDPGAPPSFLVHPNSVPTAIEGDTVTLTAQVDGDPPITLQWKLGDDELPGETGTDLILNNVTTDDSGDYTLVATNPNGSTTSNIATVTVSRPIPGLFNTGVDEFGAVLADGATDPHYQIAVNPDSESPDAVVHDSTVFPIVAGPWLANDADSKWISPRFDTGGAAGGDYTYRMNFDLTGFDPSTAFITGRWSTDNAGLDILVNGTSTGLTTGGFTSWTVFRIDPGNFVSGLNTLEFVFNNASVGYTGLRVDSLLGGAVPGGGGSGPPLILRQPENTSSEIGARAIFSVLADGAQPLSYQWRFNGADLGGAIGPELTIFNVGEASPGEYDVVVTNAEGSVTSDAATLTILRRPPEIITQPAGQFAASGEAVTFSVVADGTMPITYQWRRNGTDIAGADAADFTIDPVAESDAASYDVVLNNNDGALTSASATLTVLDRVPGVFPTGVDDDGLALTDNLVDPHYILTANAHEPQLDALAMGAIPSPPWVPNTASSRWIGPTTDSNGAPGLYTFQTTFDLLGFDPATVVIAGQWSTDNAGLAIRLNGVATGITHPGNFDTLLPFQITDGFVDGVNVLEFDVENAGNSPNPIGLRIDTIQALGDAVDVPPFEITDITYTASPLSTTFTWNSRPEELYTIETSADLITWGELDDAYPSGGDTTTYIDSDPVLQGPNVFYRVSIAPQ